MTRALLVVPPMVKSLAGPLAGPAWLAGVARSEGVHLDVLDLNAMWLRWGHPIPLPDPNGPSGDHAKPLGGLVLPEAAWNWLTGRALPAGPPRRGCEEAPMLHSFEAADEAAARLASGWLGRAWRHFLAGPRPRFVGVSVLWAGQVLGALVVSVLAKGAWPGVPVLWGGAHITALAPELAADLRYGRWVDGFVAGYAEGTFRQMLRGDPLGAPGVFAAGGQHAPTALEELDAVPCFQRLGDYGQPRLTLPVQTVRGCAYGRCAFCTYPAVEGLQRRVSDAAVAGAVERALAAGAEIAIRDALATPGRLEFVAGLVRGRVRFAATTRVVPRLGRSRLASLVRGGLRTLELGIEASDAEVLKLMAKAQSVELVEQWLGDAEGLDLHLVINVMFGFPGQTRGQALDSRRYFDLELPRRFPRTRFSIERNLLQLERRAPMAARPDAFGVEVLGSWPWSSVLAWNAPTWRTHLQLETPLAERMRARA